MWRVTAEVLTQKPSLSFCVLAEVTVPDITPTNLEFLFLNKDPRGQSPVKWAVLKVSLSIALACDE